MVPTPPKISPQRPQALLQRSNEAIEGASFTDGGSDLGSRLGQHPNFALAKNSGLNGLNDQNPLQNAPLDQGNAQKRLVGIFTGISKILEPGMVLHLFHGNRPH